MPYRNISKVMLGDNQAGIQFKSITHLVDKRLSSEPCERARNIKHTVPPCFNSIDNPDTIDRHHGDNTPESQVRTAILGWNVGYVRGYKHTVPSSSKTSFGFSGSQA